MSRHRNAMRKVSICDDDYDDDIAQSYDDSYGVSPGTSDMYTFNRNKENTSLSQFMASGQKIMEEEDDESQNEEMSVGHGVKSTDSQQMDHSGQLSKLSDDFMFDMDDKKEPHYAVQKKIDVDLQNLLNNTNNQAVESSNNNFEGFDLNSLAEQYQTGNKSTSPITNILLKNNPDLNESKPLSSSIDKLLDSFFSKNFTETPTPTNAEKNLESEFDFNLNDTLKIDDNNDDGSNQKINEEFDLNSILAQRTQSIEINIEKKSPDTYNSNNNAAGFSLSELANEYLNTPSSSTVDLIGDNTSSVTSNLVDLIDSEFNNTDFDLGAEMGKIAFSGEGLLINKSIKNKAKTLSEETNRLSSSLNLKSNLNCVNELRRSSCYDASESLIDKINTKRISPSNLKLENFVFIASDKTGSEILENVHIVGDRSLFGDFLATEHSELFEHQIRNPTNSLFEVQFDINRQKSLLTEKSRNEMRRKISIECLGKHERRLKSKLAQSKLTESELLEQMPQKTAQRTHKTSSSRSKTQKGSVKSKLAKDTKKILIFDFSIPSPDDIVIAKQKFAFKNMRFK